MTQVTGELEAFGIEEIEPGIVADTTHNRRRLMAMDGNWSWERVLDEEGAPTGLLRPLSPEDITRARTSVAVQRAPILSVKDDPWSDYVHPDLYPLDVDLPWWVTQRLHKWREDAAAGIPEQERRAFPIRCTQLRVDGTRCWLWVNKPKETSKCNKHRGVTREAVEAHPGYARMRLLEASTDAVDNLIALAFGAEGEAVRLKANTEILDRAGVRGGTELDVTGTVVQVDPGEQLRKRLETLTARHTPVAEDPPPPSNALPVVRDHEIVDAEIVEDTP